MSMGSRPEDPGATPPDPDDHGGSQLPAQPRAGRGAFPWRRSWPPPAATSATRPAGMCRPGESPTPIAAGLMPPLTLLPVTPTRGPSRLPALLSPRHRLVSHPISVRLRVPPAKLVPPPGLPPARRRDLRPARRRDLGGRDLLPRSAAGSSPGSAEEPAARPDEEDPFGEDELRAAEQGAGQAVPLDDLAGHARLTPGPALASWLSCMDAAQLDDAALANSITAWRKVTSWAQARELAAVAELARRRGVALAPQPGRPPADQLQANFAPNEIALALTLTGCSADYWMSLAVSLDSRLPATLAALAAGQDRPCPREADRSVHDGAR